MHALRSASNVDVHSVPQTFVYAHPTISALSAFLSRLLAGESTVDVDAERAAGLERMRAMLEKYSAGMEGGFPSKAANGHVNGRATETVIITGTTGRLGAHLLAQLLAREDVARVYALNREPSGSVEKLTARSKDAFEKWGLDASLLAGGKVTFHAADLAQPNFGLTSQLHDEVREFSTIGGT